MSELPFSITLPIYWEDTDAGGVVYHANYLRFLERARSEWLRALGVGQQALKSEQDRVFAIRGMQIDFRLPARLDDLLRVQVDRVVVGRASLSFQQSILRQAPEGGALLLTATVRAACLSASRFRPSPIPEHIRRLLPAGTDNQINQPDRAGTE
ncbi:tol-pal system-associated acyl-CoA thioesterase [Pseudomarimonas salicorniae]|uniref:Tol-pal system-associated acyl-CoA thioesterase n=1 Tax=Pseudomarimonas salicorniae TaxID=2933270 RepID=A0ABT0GDL9_9GAMM|nr:tol-pal system-associated acyl-CoA thioesterase [Lysobacter sp. CAU 1642]